METQLDFLTHVKGVEYIISVIAIAAFIVFVEILKPRPFRKLAAAAGEDIACLREAGLRDALATAGKVLAAPFLGVAYVIALPFVFVFVGARRIGGLAAEGAGRIFGAAGEFASFGWRPTEAYFAGKRGRKRVARTGGKA